MTIAALLFALTLSSDVREALPTTRWTPEDVRTVVRAVLKDDQIDAVEKEMLLTLTAGKPYPPAPAPPPHEAHMLGLLVTPRDLAVLVRQDEGWRTMVEIATLCPQTEGLIVGFTALHLSRDAADVDRLTAVNAALPPDLRTLGAKILEDARAQLEMERERG